MGWSMVLFCVSLCYRPHIELALSEFGTFGVSPEPPAGVVRDAGSK